MSAFILALDQGTTSSRAILFDRAGNVVRSAQLEFPQIYPQAGRVEHDPREIWASQLQVARDIVEDPRDIAAIGISNQRETTLIWDRATGQPIHNAIVWQDRRTAQLCDQLKEEGFDQLILRQTGLVTDAYFSGTKAAWLLEHVDGARERAEAGQLAFGTVDSYLVWQLTGGALHITDVSNASRTMLFDIHRGDWSDEILQRLRIPRAILAPDAAQQPNLWRERPGDFLGQPSRLPAWRATSRQPLSGRRPTSRAAPRILMAQAVSC